MTLGELTDQQREWIEGYCNQTLSAEAFAEFETALESSPELRAALRQYLALDANLREGSESLAEIGHAWQEQTSPSDKVIRFPKWVAVSAAAAAAFAVGIMSDRMITSDTEVESEVAAIDEVKASGYAVLQGLAGAAVNDANQPHRTGEVLSAEVFSLASGSARIDFFCGAQIYLEAPAKLEIRSAWEAVFHGGKLRAKVPPAARGFVIESRGRRIVDLGTEFGIDTQGDEVHLEVFTGKVELEQRELVTGEAVAFSHTGDITAVRSERDNFSQLFSMGQGLHDSTRERFATWQAHSATLSRDPRLIAYYPFHARADQQPDVVPSGLLPGNPELDGAVIMGEWVDGRWSGLKQAMEFRRPGSRIRVNIPGEFSAYTFSCWARIDSLDRRYNALFLSDSYQTGEPHWQIRNDGLLMLGVMVDDARPHSNPALKGGTERHSRNYYSPPFWDMTMSGQWLHLVSVFDPESRRVSHFINGEQISEQEIKDNFFIDRLRIGNAEIGNWGDPVRKDPEFAIRNLNGRIDELAIFDDALSAEEIAELYRLGRN